MTTVRYTQTLSRSGDPRPQFFYAVDLDDKTYYVNQDRQYTVAFTRRGSIRAQQLPRNAVLIRRRIDAAIEEFEKTRI